MALNAEQSCCPLGDLSKIKAQTADIAVEVFYPKNVQYSCQGKNESRLLQKVKFSCMLFGQDVSHYCDVGMKASTDRPTASTSVVLLSLC